MEQRVSSTHISIPSRAGLTGSTLVWAGIRVMLVMYQYIISTMKTWVISLLGH